MCKYIITFAYKFSFKVFDFQQFLLDCAKQICQNNSMAKEKTAH